MILSKTAIKRGVTFFMLYIVAVGFGLFSLGRLKIDLFPELDFPVVAVITQYTGVGPFDIETVVTRPIEETVSSVQNVKTVHSNSRQGFSLVILEFEWGADMDQAEIDVRNSLDFIEDYLPDDISDPMVFAFDPSMQPIAFMSVGSKLHGLAELRKISEEDIEPRLERIPGVASASTSGGLRREIRILLDPVRLRAHNISVMQVENALRANNLQLPSGWIDNQQQEFTIQTQGEYKTVEEIKNTAVSMMRGSVIRISDVAEVVDGFAENRQKVFINDNPAVLLILQKQSDANTVNTIDKVHNRMENIIQEIPKGVKIETIWDQADFINQSMTNLGNTAIQAIILAFLILLFFLRNFRSSIIVAISIPISMIVTFAVMDQAGLTLNIISMAGLALAVGLLVDNSIVVLESIYRLREQGDKPREAADTGTSEVSTAIIASTLTTVSVFLPVLFVPGIAGEMFNDMVVTICFSLAVSLIVALTLVPLLASRFLKINQTGKKTSRLHRLSQNIGNWIDNLKDTYLIALDWSLKHKLQVIIITLVTFIIAIALLFTRGGEFIPKTDQGFIELTVNRSPGTSLPAMEKSMHQLDEIIKNQVPEAEMVYTNFGQGEGMFAVFSTSGSHEGEIMVRLVPRSKRSRSSKDIENDLRQYINKLPDVEVQFSEGGAAMFGAEADIVIQLFGYDLEVAKTLANDIEKQVSTVENIVDTEVSIEKTAPELKIQLNRNRIADLGLSTSQIGRVISTNILGNVVSQFREAGNEYDIRVQLKEEFRQNKNDLENILITTPIGQQIPLRSIATIELSDAPTEINREDQERVVSVNCSVEGSDLRGATAQVRKIIKDFPLPNDFRIEIGGAAEDMMEAFMYLGLAFLVAMLLTYMVMASQFESLLDPFVILFTIPMSLIGVSLALFITGTTLSVMSLIGAIMLLGIIVNNG
ncbi:MAG: efflux RND transporter permease subunit, partial [bacterium]